MVDHINTILKVSTPGWGLEQKNVILGIDLCKVTAKL